MKMTRVCPSWKLAKALRVLTWGPEPGEPERPSQIRNPSQQGPSLFWRCPGQTVIAVASEPIKGARAVLAYSKVIRSSAQSIGSKLNLSSSEALPSSLVQTLYVLHLPSNPRRANWTASVFFLVFSKLNAAT